MAISSTKNGIFHMGNTEFTKNSMLLRDLDNQIFSSSKKVKELIRRVPHTRIREAQKRRMGAQAAHK